MSMMVTGRLVEETNNFVIKKSCKYCVHFNVCALYRAIKPLLENWEDQKPFLPEDLANICREWKSRI